jgi:hypothetical protein
MIKFYSSPQSRRHGRFRCWRNRNRNQCPLLAAVARMTIRAPAHSACPAQARRRRRPCRLMEHAPLGGPEAATSAYGAVVSGP